MGQLQIDKTLLKGIRILVVEDDGDLRESIVAILQLFGAETIEAENGKKAFEMFKQNPVDFILSDIRMPGGDGVSLLEQVRAVNPARPPFFFLSGYSDLTPADALAKGAQALLTKPYDSFQLAQAILKQVRPETTPSK